MYQAKIPPLSPFPYQEKGKNITNEAKNTTLFVAQGLYECLH